MKHRFFALKLTAVLIAIYIVQLLVPGLTDLFMLQASTFAAEPWTILTSTFIHAPSDYMHLLNNIFFLAIFGTMLERYIGPARFLGLYLAAGIVANLAAFIFYPDTPVLGASGAISGIVGFLAVLRPRQVGLFWGVPLPMWAVMGGWLATNAVGIGASAGIAFEAHLLGLLFGAVAAVPFRDQQRSDQDDEDVEIDDQTIKEWEEQYLA